MKQLRLFIALAAAATFAASTALAHEEKHKGSSATDEVTVTGEVVDLVCYIDHGESGTEHADCAKECIKMGLPVGIKAHDGKTYLLVGEHKPLNEKLATLAAKTITVKGKVVSRDGFNMIENAEIVKQ
jgi:type 1 fimbria pilin